MKYENKDFVELKCVTHYRPQLKRKKLGQSNFRALTCVIDIFSQIVYELIERAF